MTSITIVIATFNAARNLSACLESIRRQRNVKAEVIVADGGSSDETIDVIKTFDDVVTLWWSGLDDGIYDAWNKALARSTGDYVMFLGSDDALAHPDVLSRLERQVAGSAPDVATSLGQLQSEDGRVGPVFGTPWPLSGLPRRHRVCHPGLLHRRSLFHEFGLFEPRYRIAADFDFACRLPMTIRTTHLPEVSVLVGDSGVSRERFWQRIREYREIHQRHPLVGPTKAWVYWADKAWRRPIAKALGLTH